MNTPTGYSAKRQTAAGRKGAKRWEIYRGTEQTYDAWVGDIVSWPEGHWSWQPRDQWYPTVDCATLADALSYLE